MVLVDIHGSCLSRNIFNVSKDTNISVNNYFSRNNIVSSMMPPADISTTQEELVYNSEYSHRCLRNAIEKNTVPLLLKSDSNFLVIDFFDLCQPVVSYKNTTFSTYDYSFFNTAAFKNEPEKFQNVNFLDIPTCLWYGYMDIYWEKMIEKFGANIILIRVKCRNQYISTNREVKDTPSRLLRFGDAAFNKQLLELEEYIIQKYNPYVIDVSKYFIADENHNPDVTPVHFEENYSISSWSLMQNIIVNKPKQRYHDNLSPKVVSELLGRDLDDHNFELIWKDTESCFVGNDLLDDIAKKSDTKDIIENRRWLSVLYRKFDEVHNILLSEEDFEKRLSLINNFINKVQVIQDNVYENQFINKLKEKQAYLNQPVQYLSESFMSALREGDLEWIKILDCLGILLPQDEGVMYYKLQYYTALNDNAMIYKLQTCLQ